MNQSIQLKGSSAGRGLHGLVPCILAAAAISLALPVMAHGHADHAKTGENATPSNVASGLQVTEHAYQVPTMTLKREDGRTAAFPAEFEDGRPVVMTFIYSSCKALCPVMSHVLVDLQKKLGDQAERVHMMSVTLDPEYDTPKRLSAYAKSLGAGKQWNHYTGSQADIIRLEKAFNVYYGDKMNHGAIFFVRSAPGQSWARIQGFVKTDQLIGYLNLK